jgi:DNA-binding NarL/FixJ family response regulator
MMPLFVDSQSAFLFTSLLFIGPNPETVEIWRHTLLRQWSYYCILQAYTAEYGLEILRSKPLDCVVLDLDLPPSGLRILQGLSVRNHPSLAAVVLTEAKSKEVHDLVQSYGAHACIAKDHLATCNLHRIIQDAIEGAWNSRLHHSRMIDHQNLRISGSIPSTSKAC